MRTRSNSSPRSQTRAGAGVEVARFGARLHVGADRRHAAGAQIGGAALHRVGEPRQARRVLPEHGVTEVGEAGRRVLKKQVGDVPEEAGRGFLQPAKLVEHQLVERSVLRLRLCWRLRLRLRFTRARPRRDRRPALQRGGELLRIDRLGDIVVHSRRQAPGARVGHHIRRQRDDRDPRAVLFLFPDQAARRVAVHLGHLAIHQDRRVGRARGRLDRLLAVRHDIRRIAEAGENAEGDLLIDDIVLGDQDPHGMALLQQFGVPLGGDRGIDLDEFAFEGAQREHPRQAIDKVRAGAPAWSGRRRPRRPGWRPPARGRRSSSAGSAGRRRSPGRP